MYHFLGTVEKADMPIKPEKLKTDEIDLWQAWHEIRGASHELKKLLDAKSKNMATENDVRRFKESILELWKLNGWNDLTLAKHCTFLRYIPYAAMPLLFRTITIVFVVIVLQLYR
jgi:hypothetical protein